MADSIPRFTDADVDLPAQAPPSGKTRIFKPSDQTAEAARPVECHRTFLSTIDLPMLVILGLLLAIGSLMIYSTTFDWSYAEPTAAIRTSSCSTSATWRSAASFSCC